MNWRWVDFAVSCWISRQSQKNMLHLSKSFEIRIDSARWWDYLQKSLLIFTFCSSRLHLNARIIIKWYHNQMVPSGNLTYLRNITIICRPCYIAMFNFQRVIFNITWDQPFFLMIFSPDSGSQDSWVAAAISDNIALSECWQPWNLGKSCRNCQLGGFISINSSYCCLLWLIHL